MRINEIMEKDVEVIAPQSTLADAAKKMKDENIGCLPVCDGDRLIGMITDRDLVIRGLALNKDCAKMQVKDVMTSPIAFCFDDQSVEDMARMMEERKVRRIIILNRDHKLAGIASLDDLAERRALVGESLSRVTNSVKSRSQAA